MQMDKKVNGKSSTIVDIFSQIMLSSWSFTEIVKMIYNCLLIMFLLSGVCAVTL